MPGWSVGCYTLRYLYTGQTDKTDADVPVQLAIRNRCKSAMRGLGYGARIEMRVTFSTHRFVPGLTLPKLLSMERTAIITGIIFSPAVGQKLVTYGGAHIVI